MQVNLFPDVSDVAKLVGAQLGVTGHITHTPLTAPEWLWSEDKLKHRRAGGSSNCCLWCAQEMCLGILWQWWNITIPVQSDPFLHSEFVDSCTREMNLQTIASRVSTPWFPGRIVSLEWSSANSKHTNGLLCTRMARPQFCHAIVRRTESSPCGRVWRLML